MKYLLKVESSLELFFSLRNFYFLHFFFSNTFHNRILTIDFHFVFLQLNFFPFFWFWYMFFSEIDPVHLTTHQSLLTCTTLNFNHFLYHSFQMFSFCVKSFDKERLKCVSNSIQKVIQLSWKRSINHFKSRGKHFGDPSSKKALKNKIARIDLCVIFFLSALLSEVFRQDKKRRPK